jgi:exodeoxyribonuclease V alpha subunit
LLAAPTGKAAKRMSEATGRQAQTLHRLLKVKPSEAWFYGGRHETGTPLEVDFVFVDEASMIDTMLMGQLVSCVGKARLRLIGDANQLPPVGAGQPFVDLIKSKLVPVSWLSTLHRSSARSWVAKSAPLVLQGHMPDLDSHHEDFTFVEARHISDVADAIAVLAEDIQHELQDGRATVLSPVHGTAGGVVALNKLLHELLNPELLKDEPHLEVESGLLRVGSRVMITRNDAKRSVCNGDIGRICEVVLGKDGKSVVEVIVSLEDEGGVHRYSRAQAVKDLDLAYCFTVHKSQGSEYREVVIVCHHAHRMTTRRLFYTAITRARKKVTLVGTRDSVRHALANDVEKKRITRLIERARKEVEQLESEVLH